ncbi:MAG: hypothetical protein FWG13_06260, partial [Leptospirales bacterium]|nr:hypothetical protein [Leptospirales bacterium]
MIQQATQQTKGKPKINAAPAPLIVGWPKASRQTDRQTDRKTDRQKNRKKEKQKERTKERTTERK